MSCDSQYIKHSIVIEKRLGFVKNFQKFDFKLMESERSMFDWSSKKIYIALANMMTSAAMINIDSCPIEGFNAKEMEKVLVADFGVDSC
jgi:nitroreductase